MREIKSNELADVGGATTAVSAALVASAASVASYTAMTLIGGTNDYSLMKVASIPWLITVPADLVYRNDDAQQRLALSAVVGATWGMTQALGPISAVWP